MTRKGKRTVYENMTSDALEALAQGQAPEQAWETAKLHLEGTPNTPGGLTDFMRADEK